VSVWRCQGDKSDALVHGRYQQYRISCCGLAVMLLPWFQTETTWMQYEIPGQKDGHLPKLRIYVSKQILGLQNDRIAMRRSIITLSCSISYGDCHGNNFG